MSRKFRRIEWRDEENKSDPLGTPLLDIPRGWHVEIACKSQGNLASPPDMVIEPKFTPYLTHLRKLPHSHYLAGTEEDPVVITVEEIESGAEKKPQRTIIRTKEHDVLVLMPTGVDRKPIYQQLVTSSIGNIKQASSPLLNDQLVLFEETNEYVCFKMGILYCKTNQNTELEMLTNSEPSVHCQEFLDMLGTTVNLEEHQGYRGGLDAHRDGKFSLFTQYEDIEIMWHVSTMLTHNPADPKHVTKKRHIGNDVVNVIFRDPPVDGVPHRPLNPNIIRSQLTQVILVVEKLADEGETKYRLAVSTKDGVPCHLPHLPCPPVFSKGDFFRKFLLAKLVNSDRAAQHAPAFRKRHVRGRQTFLQHLLTSVDKPPPSPGMGRSESSPLLV
eukprot:TRINITY_DN2211_c0_g2_i6.p1 TRINITY_DN2211_c0_g2~~TRINITY_DN2211_c0_g2_i6.p1  ORF type:complete len:386 (+),score=104.68 TRINITY_DN2211_c0_g2_i6:1243-2400(+)